MTGVCREITHESIQQGHTRNDTEMRLILLHTGSGTIGVSCARLVAALTSCQGPGHRRVGLDPHDESYHVLINLPDS